MRGAIVLAGVLLALLFPPPAAATNFPAVGGSGDATAVDQCPAGMYLVGLRGRTGLWIDQVQIVCAPVTPPVFKPGFDPTPVSGGTGPKWYGPARGGGGGGLTEDDCQTGTVVTGANVSLTPSKQVLGVYLPCSPVGSNAMAAPTDFEGARRGPDFINAPPNTCPAGETGMGFTIRYGKHVNAMGLICQRR